MELMQLFRTARGTTNSRGQWRLYSDYASARPPRRRGGRLFRFLAVFGGAAAAGYYYPKLFPGTVETDSTVSFILRIFHTLGH
jgi:hypothetical protein